MRRGREDLFSRAGVSVTGGGAGAAPVTLATVSSGCMELTPSLGVEQRKVWGSPILRHRPVC